MICGLCLQNYFMELIWSYGFDSFSDAADELMGGQVYDVVISVLTVVGTLWLIYAMWFAAAYLLRPVFSVGLWEYVKRYSLVYQIFPWIKKQFKKTGNRIRQWWNTLSGEITHIDFSFVVSSDAPDQALQPSQRQDRIVGVHHLICFLHSFCNSLEIPPFSAI